MIFYFLLFLSKMNPYLHTTIFLIVSYINIKLFLYVKKRVEIINKIIEDVNNFVNKYNESMEEDGIFDKYKIGRHIKHKTSEYISFKNSEIQTSFFVLIMGVLIMLFSLFYIDKILFTIGFILDLVYCLLSYLYTSDKEESEIARLKFYKEK